MCVPTLVRGNRTVELSASLCCQRKQMALFVCASNPDLNILWATFSTWNTLLIIRSVSLCADWEIRHSSTPPTISCRAHWSFFPFQTAQRCYGYEWLITMGVSPCVEHFTCVVKMLYNLQFIQALAALSSKFSPEERQAWSSAGALKKVKVKSGGPTHDSVWTSPLFSSVKQTAVTFVLFSLWGLWLIVWFDLSFLQLVCTYFLFSFPLWPSALHLSDVYCQHYSPLHCRIVRAIMEFSVVLNSLPAGERFQLVFKSLAVACTYLSRPFIWH